MFTRKAVAALAASLLFALGASPALAVALPATVRLESIPPGAEVLLRGTVVGRTPTRVQVPAGRRMQLTLRKEGFRAQPVPLPPLRPGQVRQVEVRLRRR